MLSIFSCAYSSLEKLLFTITFWIHSNNSLAHNTPPKLPLKQPLLTSRMIFFFSPLLLLEWLAAFSLKNTGQRAPWDLLSPRCRSFSASFADSSSAPWSLTLDGPHDSAVEPLQFIYTHALEELIQPYSLKTHFPTEDSQILISNQTSPLILSPTIHSTFHVDI